MTENVSVCYFCINLFWSAVFIYKMQRIFFSVALCETLQRFELVGGRRWSGFLRRYFASVAYRLAAVERCFGLYKWQNAEEQI